MQSAFWGMIYPEIRAISVGYEGTQKLIVNCYLDREPNEDDYENIAEVTSELFADINFMDAEENCIYLLEPISKFDN